MFSRINTQQLIALFVVIFGLGPLFLVLALFLGFQLFDGWGGMPANSLAAKLSFSVGYYLTILSPAIGCLVGFIIAWHKRRDTKLYFLLPVGCFILLELLLYTLFK